jgi:hypothetical protein
VEFTERPSECQGLQVEKKNCVYTSVLLNPDCHLLYHETPSRSSIDLTYTTLSSPSSSKRQNPSSDPVLDSEPTDFPENRSPRDLTANHLHLWCLRIKPPSLNVGWEVFRLDQASSARHCTVLDCVLELPDVFRPVIAEAELQCF